MALTRSEQAVHCFSQGFNCAQAVLGVFCQHFNFDKDTAMKLTTGFGGGMQSGHMCGAVTGALMVIGLKYGHGMDKDPEAKTKTGQMVLEFQKRFIDENGSLICKEILGYDLSKPKELEIIKDKGLIKSLCPDMVASAVDILEKMI
jgi:C_GCAxxG_C_C family probable redox protein